MLRINFYQFQLYKIPGRGTDIITVLETNLQKQRKEKFGTEAVNL